MDAVKINSLIHALRPEGGARPGAAPGNAQADAAFAARVAAAVLLDGVLQASEGEAHSAPIVPPALPLTPRAGVVVSLSPAVVAAEIASRLGNAPPRPADHAGAKPDPAMAAVPPHLLYAMTERLAESSRAGAVTNGSPAASLADDRRGTAVPSVFAPAPQPETRTDVFAFVPPPMTASHRIELPEARSSAATALEQARDSERLAGLNARGEAPVFSRWLRFDRLVLGAIVAAVLVLILL